MRCVKRQELMLVLTRNPGDGVLIGKDILVKVRSIKGKQVKLGVEAPASVRVLREELIDRRKTRFSPEGGEPDFRVLVVEDDPGHAELIQMAFTDYGVRRVTVAQTGEGALQLMVRLERRKEVLRPHLILLDLGLPGMSGLEVLRQMRTMPALSTVPVVMLSCSGDEDEAQRCLAEGANAFVRKDLRFDAFQDSVSRIADFWSHAQHIA